MTLVDIRKLKFVYHNLAGKLALENVKGLYLFHFHHINQSLRLLLFANQVNLSQHMPRSLFLYWKFFAYFLRENFAFFGLDVR